MSRRSNNMNSSAAVGANSGFLTSTPLTHAPSAFSRLTRWLPMNPPAPQTTTCLIPRPPVSSSDQRHAAGDAVDDQRLQHLFADDAVTAFRVVARRMERKQRHRIAFTLERRKQVYDRNLQLAYGLEDVVARACGQALIEGLELRLESRPIRQIHE